jgi:C-terminal processing protease CtpA/Prc
MHYSKLIKYALILLVGILVVLTACKKDDEANILLNNEINEFIWQGMRTYYLWQEEVPDLDDDRFDSFDELHEFLNRFTNPEDLFDHFKHPADRFSRIYDDYEVLEKAKQGISTSFGYEFKIVRIGETADVFGYVAYIIPNSPAANSNLKRGDVFHSVNGVTLTDSNFIELLLETENQILSLGDFISITDGVEDNGETISLSAVELTENPVFLTKTFDIGDKKVGYLVYNQFVSSFHSELNASIGQLVSEGVSEMVLDLRYNPGGSVTTSRILGSMLYADATSSSIFGSYFYNSRLEEFNTDITFFESVPIFDAENNEIGEEAMNRLELDRLFILTGSGTASASELLISGLLPYIDITLIGSTTVGKNVGSITLYDSPETGYLRKEGINLNHRYAMQLIIIQLANSLGFSDYVNGFNPNIEIDELDYIGDLKPLGDVSEPLLAEALLIIAESGRSSAGRTLDLHEIFDSRQNRPFSYTLLDSNTEKINFKLTNSLFEN